MTAALLAAAACESGTWPDAVAYVTVGLTITGVYAAYRFTGGDRHEQRAEADRQRDHELQIARLRKDGGA